MSLTIKTEIPSHSKHVVDNIFKRPGQVNIFVGKGDVVKYTYTVFNVGDNFWEHQQLCKSLVNDPTTNVTYDDLGLLQAWMTIRCGLHLLQAAKRRVKG